jgi:hypothetical protein
MRTPTRLVIVVASLVLASPTAASFAQAPAVTPAAGTAVTPAESAKTWPEHRGEIEAFLKSADVVSMEDLKIGVTHPHRAKLAPGGPVEYIAFKDVPPGRPAGYWESYKSEIAAYEMDKLLGLEMVPPTVEKRVKGNLGAAVMWCSPTKSFHDLGGVPTPPPQQFARWTRQLVRAKMFDNLIGNKDPNLGNWLVDPAWNLILIDHTRAFTTDKDLVHKLEHVDSELWDKMKGLTLESITPVLSPYMGKGEIKAIIARRDKLAQMVDKMVAEQGEAAVMLK